MKSCLLLLLLLPLITGVGAMMKIEACYDQWVEFTCTYPKASSSFPVIRLPMSPGTGKVPMSPNIQLVYNRWVSIKHLTPQHVGEYSCGHRSVRVPEFSGIPGGTSWQRLWGMLLRPPRETLREGAGGTSRRGRGGKSKEDEGGTSQQSDGNNDNDHNGNSDEDGNSCDDDNVGKIIIEGQECKEKRFTQVSYLTAPITLTCRYNNTNRNTRFLCKDNISTCVEIVSTQSALSPDGQFSLKPTGAGFTVTIVNVTEKHNGTYRCGLELCQGSRQAVKEIDLRTENITKLDLHKPAGEAFTFLCPGAFMNTVICKGEDPSTCKTLFNASKSMSERIVSDNKNKGNLTVKMMDLRESDSGTYWCGSRSSDPHESNRFHLRMKLTVVSVPMVTSPALVSSASPSTDQGSLQLSLIISAACLAVLLLALAGALIYRKKTRHGEVENVMEDPFYAEIQDPPQKSADAVKTIYTTATLPFRPHCNGSAEVETRCHDYSTISHPIKTPQEQFYSTASAPQQL